MARFVSDKNQVAYLFESGTYAVTSGLGQWPGLVINHEIDEELNIEQTRFVGQDTLNIGRHDTGDEDYAGTLEMHPQNWKWMGYALGSIFDTGSPSPYQHNLSETNSEDGNAFTSGTKNPPFSFTIEDARVGPGTGLNKLRTLKGCVVDSYELTGAQGEKLTENVAYKAQNCTFTSGAVTAVTASTSTPFRFNMCTFELPGGTTIDGVKDFTFGIEKNVNFPHYGNGSTVTDTPNLQERNYSMELTCAHEQTWAKTFYDQYFKGGSEFNMQFNVLDPVAGAGSRDLTVTLSGCRIMDMPNPTLSEGTDEITISIIPTSVDGQSDDLVELYNPW